MNLTQAEFQTLMQGVHTPETRKATKKPRRPNGQGKYAQDKARREYENNLLGKDLATVTRLMSRDKVPEYWGKRPVTLTGEEKFSIEFADRMRGHVKQGNYRGIWLHIPNESHSSVLGHIKTNAMGRIPGALDYVFIWNNSQASAWIEFKFDKNKTSLDQDDFLHWLHINQIPKAVVRCQDLESMPAAIMEAEAHLQAWGALSLNGGGV